MRIIHGDPFSILFTMKRNGTTESLAGWAALVTLRGETTIPNVLSNEIISGKLRIYCNDTSIIPLDQGLKRQRYATNQNSEYNYVINIKLTSPNGLEVIRARQEIWLVEDDN